MSVASSDSSPEDFIEPENIADLQVNQNAIAPDVVLDRLENSYSKPKLFGDDNFSGYVSTYGEKIIAELCLWFSSLIVWGTAANLSALKGCDSLCGWQIAVGILSWFYISVILICNILVEVNVMSRYGWFTHKVEMQMILALVVWWIPGAAAMSAVESDIQGTAVVFSWICFFGGILATWKCYHSYKEEDHPTQVDESISKIFADEEIYG